MQQSHPYNDQIRILWNETHKALKNILKSQLPFSDQFLEISFRGQKYFWVSIIHYVTNDNEGVIVHYFIYYTAYLNIHCYNIYRVNNYASMYIFAKYYTLYLCKSTMFYMKICISNTKIYIIYNHKYRNHWLQLPSLFQLFIAIVYVLSHLSYKFMFSMV